MHMTVLLGAGCHSNDSDKRKGKKYQKVTEEEKAMASLSSGHIYARHGKIRKTCSDGCGGQCVPGSHLGRIYVVAAF